MKIKNGEIIEAWGYEALHNTDCVLCGNNGCDMCHAADAWDCEDCSNKAKTLINGEY